MLGLRGGRARGEVFNLGTGFALDQAQVIKRILRYFPGSKATTRKPSEYMKKEIRYQKLDSSKIRKSLGWIPKRNIDAGLEKTIGWWKGQPGIYRRPVNFTN